MRLNKDWPHKVINKTLINISPKIFGKTFPIQKGFEDLVFNRLVLPTALFKTG